MLIIFKKCNFLLLTVNNYLMNVLPNCFLNYLNNSLKTAEKILGVINLANQLSFKENIYDCVDSMSKIYYLLCANVKYVINLMFIRLLTFT